MHYFVERFGQRHGRNVSGFTAPAIDAMLSYEWPGNIRELENIIERGVILATENRAVDVDHLFTGGEQFPTNHYALDRQGALTAAERLQAVAARIGENSFSWVSKRVSDLLLDAGEDHDSTSLDDIDAVLLKKAAQRARGNVSAASRILGISRAQLSIA